MVSMSQCDMKINICDCTYNESCNYYYIYNAASQNDAHHCLGFSGLWACPMRVVQAHDLSLLLFGFYILEVTASLTYLLPLPFIDLLPDSSYLQLKLGCLLLHLRFIAFFYWNRVCVCIYWLSSMCFVHLFSFIYVFL